MATMRGKTVVRWDGKKRCKKVENKESVLAERLVPGPGRCGQRPSRRRNGNRKRGVDSRHSQSKYDIAIPKRNAQVVGQVLGGRVGMNEDLRGLPLASATSKRPKTHLCGIFGLSKGNINSRKGKLGDGKLVCRRHEERKFGGSIVEEVGAPHGQNLPQHCRCHCRFIVVAIAVANFIAFCCRSEHAQRGR
jgi:hypothetical protein